MNSLTANTTAVTLTPSTWTSATCAYVIATTFLVHPNIPTYSWTIPYGNAGANSHLFPVKITTSGVPFNLNFMLFTLQWADLVHNGCALTYQLGGV